MAIVSASSGSYGFIQPDVTNRIMLNYRYTGLTLAQGGGEDTDLELIVGPVDRNPKGVFHSIRFACSAQADQFDVSLRDKSGLGTTRNTWDQLMIWENCTDGWFVASYDGMHIPYKTKALGKLYLAVKNEGTSGIITDIDVTIVVDIDQKKFTIRHPVFTNLP